MVKPLPIDGIGTVAWAGDEDGPVIREELLTQGAKAVEALCGCVLDLDKMQWARCPKHS